MELTDRMDPASDPKSKKTKRDMRGRANIPRTPICVRKYRRPGLDIAVDGIGTSERNLEGPQKER